MPKKIKFKRVKVKVQGPKTLLLITGLTFLIAMLFSYITNRCAITHCFLFTDYHYYYWDFF